MKSLMKFLAVIAAVMSFVSCIKGDGDAEYGNCYIYIPQATQSGSLNNHYNVPSGDGPYTYNFKVEDGLLKIMMGVLRSGKTEGNPYTADIAENSAATDKFITEMNGDSTDKYMKMPAIYTFPSKIEVGKGENGKTFYIEIPVSEVEKLEYDSKVLVLTLKLMDSTGYPLSEKNTEVVVLLDTDSIEKHF